MKEMIKRRKDEGFTLIELMIVIAVIGILAVVLVPKVGSIKAQAKSAGVDTNVRAVEAFVQSRISYWASSTPVTAQWTSVTAGIQPEIQKALTGNITNPISGSTNIVASSDGTTLPTGTVNDALQIGGTALSTVLPKGGVVVLSTGTGVGLSITVTGYDSNGIVTSTVTMTP